MLLRNLTEEKYFRCKACFGFRLRPPLPTVQALATPLYSRYDELPTAFICCLPSMGIVCSMETIFGI